MSISWLQTKSSHILHVLSYVSFFLEKIFFAGDSHWMLATSVSWQKDVNTLRSVNALSGWYLISTAMANSARLEYLHTCQCPLGLISHFYMSNITTMVMAYLLCQCPLGLISHFYYILQSLYARKESGVNALSGWYLISTVPLQKPRFYAVSRTCFCRYLSEYSDNSRFSCMLTFWTYLMRCTYPWHWI